MNIPFLDLHAQYLSIKEEIDEAIADTIKNSAYIKSPSVTDFENEFAEFLGAENVITCGNGTDAIEILLTAMGIGKGDEVLVPAMSWISTSETVATAGATPVFVDIRPDTYVIDERLIADKITSRTKAIIPVHLYGCPANMSAIMDLSEKYDLKVIEDCAQAHGAELNGKKIGTIGHAATFSFFPTKNLGAYGDAGAMLTNDSELAEKARSITNHGQQERHTHRLDGRNSRMDGMQAAILSVKLRHLEAWTKERIRKAALYTSLLKDVPEIQVPTSPKDAKHVYHLYVIQLEKREALRAYLAEEGISTLVHYPKALPFQPCYGYQENKASDYPVANMVQDSVLSLPLYPELEDETIVHIAETLKKFNGL